LLWYVVAFLNPQSFLWSASDVFPWALAIAIPTIAGFALFSRDWRRMASPGSWLIASLWLWFTITSLVSTQNGVFMHHAADTWERWSFVSKILLMTLFTIAIVDSFARLRTLVLVAAACFGVFVAKAFPFLILTGGAYRLYGPERSMIADNNDFGLALNMTLPLFFFLAQTETNRWLKRLFAFLFVITIPAIFFTYSRGALVGLTAVVMLMVLRSKRRMLLIMVIALGIIVALVFAPPAWKYRMDPTRAGVIDASANERLNAWSFCWNLVQDYPITGGGFSTFTPELFSRYAPVVLDIHGPHSVYFGLLAEHGFIGLFLYLGLVFFCFRTTSRIKKLAAFHNDQTIFQYADMFRFSLIGFLVSGTFLGRAYFDYFFAIVACIVILNKVAKDNWNREAAEEPLREMDCIGAGEGAYG